MQPSDAPQISGSNLTLALNTLKELGISNIVVVDDTRENLESASALKASTDSGGIKMDLFPGVEEFKAGFNQVARSSHTLILTDFQMPCEETVFGHKDCGGIQVINAALMSEAPERINFPVVISHAGQGHSGRVVDLCFGNDQKQIGLFPLGKADPRFWEEAIALISQQLTQGTAKELWDTRVAVNRVNPFSPSLLMEENMKFGYIPFQVMSSWSKRTYPS